MKIIVQVQNDHLEKISHVSKPINAIAEIVWNGLDADATLVQVRLAYNSLGGLEEVRISDNGHGIAQQDAEVVFSKLGGSWKNRNAKSKEKKRLLHGRGGRGRFKAFTIGKNIEWNTRYKKDNEIYEYKISGSKIDFRSFEMEDEIKSKEAETGTEVIISNIEKDFRSLKAEKAVDEITMIFALYMRQYPEVKIIYDGIEIKPSDVELNYSEFELPAIATEDHKIIESKLSIIEWKKPVEKHLYLCDQSGFSLSEMDSPVQAAGYNFTAYLKSPYLRVLDNQGSLILHDMNPDQNLGMMLESAKTEIKTYFRKREAQEAVNRVEEWKTSNIYPYKDEPRNILEVTERQVFDVCALSISDYLPDFEKSSKKAKKMALYFLKQTIEGSPESVQKILQDVLDLPKEKQNELSDLLKKTSLTAIINASKEVADRLDFIKGLEALVFDKELKQSVLERQHLHKILANKTWIFGEEFNLSSDDESLNVVLNKHLKLLGREPEKNPLPVVREDGSKGIVDLMLSRTIPQPRADEHEHLVIELKRPSQDINSEVLNQIESYALAVANDERFRDTKTKWNFCVISTEMNEFARRKANQHGRAEGIIFEDGKQNITVWAKTWGQIIENCRGRLNFYQSKLEYCATHESGLNYLKATYAKFLPKDLKLDEEEKVDLTQRKK